MSFTGDGFEILNDFVSTKNLNAIIEDVVSSDIKKQKGGIRNAEKKYQSIKNLVSSEKLLNQARHYLLNDPKVVRVIYFDKTIENNWLVTWHQDRTVAVTERFELKGWESWSVKDATHHVQPPLEVLNNMVTFRIHLDAANEKNGCLKIMPCSHVLGILSQDEINQYCNNHKPINCVVNKGDTLIMRPHLLHSSNKAVNPTNRRVVHIEFSGFRLPKGILWA